MRRCAASPRRSTRCTPRRRWFAPRPDATRRRRHDGTVAVTHRPWNSILVHLGVTVLLSVAVTATLVLVQATRGATADREEEFTERVSLAGMQVVERLRTAESLQIAGAIVLSEQPDLLAAMRARDLTRALAVGAQLADATELDAPGIGRQGLALYDPDGRLLLRIHAPLDRGQDAPPTIVMQAIHGREPVVGTRTDRLFGPTISGAAPLRDADGTLLGAIEVMVALDDRFAAGLARTIGVGIAVLDEQGTVGASNDEIAIDPVDLVNLRTTDTPLRVTLGGEDYLAESIPLTGVDGEWVGEVYVGLDYSLVTEAIATTRARVLRTLVIALAGGLGVALGIGILTTRSLRELVGSARRIRENDLDTPVPERGPRELRALASAMDEMRLAVREMREDMVVANQRLARRAAVSDAGLSAVTTEISVLNAIIADLAGSGGGGLPHVAEQLTRLGWVDGALIALFDRDGQLVPAAEAGGDTDATAALLAVARREALLLDDGVLIDDIAQHDRFVELVPHRVASFALTPIATAEGSAGVFGVYARTPTEVSEHGDLLRTIGQEIVAMLERTELVGEAQEHRYLAEAVLRGMSDGIVVLDGEMRCRVCNPAAGRMLGVSPAEALSSYAETWLPLPAAVVAQLWERARRHVDRPVAPLVVEVADRELAIHTGPFDEPGAPTPGVILLIQDLTALGEAERLKQDFVSMVGHELRTPLTMIRTTIDLLGEQPEQMGDAQRRLVEVLGTHSERLLRLITDLLDMSAIDSGQLRVQPVTIDLAALLVRAAEQQAPRAAEAGVEIFLDLPPAAPGWADRARIEQVVANLLQNAIKYTPQGGTITVRAREADDTVRIDIADTGIGIAPVDQAHLFEKFYRAESGRRRSGGTGLGLAIARSIVELHGGEIWCESDGISGTTFSFTLPRRGAADGAAGQPRTRRP